MKTVKQTILLGLAFIAYTSCNAQWGNGKKIKGNGEITTITRSTSDYDVIKLAGWMDFKLTEGTEGKITINGESNLLDYIITEVKSGELVVTTKNNTNLKPSRNKTIIITIPFEDIEKVSLSGSGDVTCSTTIDSNTFEAKVSGSGDVTLDVKAQSIEASIAGSGDLTLTGTTKNLEASVNGSGDFHGKNLNADYTEAKVTGSGDVEVVAKKKLKARVTGSGDIDYSGNPEKVDTKVTGSGDISG